MGRNPAPIVEEEKMKRIAATLLLVMLFAWPARAQEVTLDNGTGTSNFVPVWKDRSSLDTGLTIIKNAQTPGDPQINTQESFMGAIKPLLACLARNGTRAVVLEEDAFSPVVAITSGESAGCRGNVLLPFIRQ